MIECLNYQNLNDEIMEFVRFNQYKFEIDIVNHKGDLKY